MTETEQAAREFSQTLVWALNTHGIDALGVLREYGSNPRVANALGLWEWMGLSEGARN